MEQEEFTLNDFMGHNNKAVINKGQLSKKKKLKNRLAHQNASMIANQQLQQSQQQQLQLEQLEQAQQELNSEKEVMSQSLELYLKNAFFKCHSKRERKEMKKLVLQELKNVKQIGEINDYDWDSQNLPLLQREVLESRFFEKVSGYILPTKQTIQHLKMIEMIVKEIKKHIFNDTLDIWLTDGANNNKQKQINVEEDENDEQKQLQLQKKQQKLLQRQYQQQLRRQIKQQQMQKMLESQQLNMQSEQLQQQMNIHFANNLNGSDIPRISFAADGTPIEVEKQQYGENVEFDEDDFDVERMKVPVVGTCTHLEKEYLRLTSYPKAFQVRSPETLVKSFELIMQKYQQKDIEYQYFQSQFRSLRQDLLVQNIKNNFTMEVFEENARICLENSDIQEYSRCLGQLIWMYKELPDKSGTCFKEFVYYRLLQNIFEDKKDNLLSCLQEINQDDLLVSNEFEKAMKFQYAINMGNVRGFFNLYNSTQDHGKYLMNLNIKRWMIWGIRIICKTYAPQAINLLQFQCMFGFSSIEKTIEELKTLNCVFDENLQKVVIKDTLAQLDKIKL